MEENFGFFGDDAVSQMGPAYEASIATPSGGGQVSAFNPYGLLTAAATDAAAATAAMVADPNKYAAYLTPQYKAFLAQQGQKSGAGMLDGQWFGVDKKVVLIGVAVAASALLVFGGGRGSSSGGTRRGSSGRYKKRR